MINEKYYCDTRPPVKRLTLLMGELVKSTCNLARSRPSYLLAIDLPNSSLRRPFIVTFRWQGGTARLI